MWKYTKLTKEEYQMLLDGKITMEELKMGGRVTPDDVLMFESEFVDLVEEEYVGKWCVEPKEARIRKSAFDYENRIFYYISFNSQIIWIPERYVDKEEMVTSFPLEDVNLVWGKKNLKIVKKKGGKIRVLKITGRYAEVEKRLKELCKNNNSVCWHFLEYDVLNYYLGVGYFIYND